MLPVFSVLNVVGINGALTIGNWIFGSRGNTSDGFIA